MALFYLIVSSLRWKGIMILIYTPLCVFVCVCVRASVRVREHVCVCVVEHLCVCARLYVQNVCELVLVCACLTMSVYANAYVFRPECDSFHLWHFQ